MNSTQTTAKAKLFDMIFGFIKSQCIYTACRLGIFNLLDSEGELELSAIAQKTNTEPERLYFILRALAHLEVLQEKPNQVFASTELSTLLITDKTPPSDILLCTSLNLPSGMLGMS